MTLANAFAAAWKDFKKAATAVSSFLVQNAATIKTVAVGAGAVATAIDPALAPVITEFDTLEEAIIGKIAALASDAASAASLSQLFGEEWPAIQQLVNVLKSHPTVATVAATLAPPAA